MKSDSKNEFLTANVSCQLYVVCFRILMKEIGLQDRGFENSINNIRILL